MDKKDLTIVICCAGMGTRLGIGTTKALVDVCNKPLIIRQLEMLGEYDDIRIVVGYQAERVIKMVNEYRRDIMFAFNYEYEKTGVAASFSKGLVGSRKYVVVMDGDLLVRPSDMKMFLNNSEECIGVTDVNSDEPVFVDVDLNGQVTGFNQDCGKLEWSGMAKVKSKRLTPGKSHVFDMLTPLLPLPAFRLNAREIDTPDDYDRIVEWIKNGYTYS